MDALKGSEVLDLPWEYRTTRTLLLLSSLLALGILLNSLESVLIPRGFPVRVGLANLSILCGLYLLQPYDLFVLAFLRVIISSLILGSFFQLSMWLALAGGVSSVVTMSIAFRWGKGFLSMVGISLIGSATHMSAQLFVFAQLFAPDILRLYAVFLALALVSGFFIGFLMLQIERRMGFCAMKGILFRYILLEQVAPILLALLIFTFVLVSTQVLRSVEMTTSAMVPFPLLVKFLLLLLPQLLLLTVPMACLLGILIAYGRLEEHHEIEAMLAAGVSYLRVTSPAAVLGLSISLGLFFWTDAMIPRAASVKAQLGQEILHSVTSVGIQEGKFMEDLPGLVFYTKQYDPPKLKGILVYEMEGRQVKRLVLSPGGQARFDAPSRTLMVELQSGTIYEALSGEGIGVSEFGTLTFRVNVSEHVEDLVGLSKKSHRGLSRQALRQELSQVVLTTGETGAEFRRWVTLTTEYHRRYALPLACALVALLGAPLGILLGRGGRSVLFVLGVGLMTGYYFLLVGGAALAERALLSPAVGVWTPNAILLIAALGMNYWASRQD